MGSRGPIDAFIIIQMSAVWQKIVVGPGMLTVEKNKTKKRSPTHIPDTHIHTIMHDDTNTHIEKHA